MKKYTTRTELDTIALPVSGCPEDAVLYFDIETTGFAPAKTLLYLIGCVYKKQDGYYITQWFLDHPRDEKDLLTDFFDFLKGYKALVHYNGSGFDIPYIIKKCSLLGIPCDFSGIHSIDIYKSILPLKKLFKTENLKQKSMERFMGIEREDCYSGGELINIYNTYLKSKDERLLSLLLRHNHDDVTGMAGMTSLLNYSCIKSGNYKLISVELKSALSASGAPHKEAVISLELAYSLPVRVSYGNDHYYFTAFGNSARICVQAHTDELKYFYPNYKDYYYLPREDRSIHKSVAFYVDKNYRTRAKAANCYSRKTGVFLPQYEEVVSPYFKIDYYDKITYFEFTDDFRSNTGLILNYANHIFHVLLA